jgi:hypothetical protein
MQGRKKRVFQEGVEKSRLSVYYTCFMVVKRFKIKSEIDWGKQRRNIQYFFDYLPCSLGVTETTRKSQVS